MAKAKEVTVSYGVCIELQLIFVSMNNDTSSASVCTGDFNDRQTEQTQRMYLK